MLVSNNKETVIREDGTVDIRNVVIEELHPEDEPCGTDTKFVINHSNETLGTDMKITTGTLYAEKVK
ncbi:hypothetical protein ACFSMW_06555 [Virgibacillus halophilus]|uniref:Uncharacterized protein n=1 Tax=Tigheibacillus halophilus TaxID=361280 RepID=A0ABU5C6F2_9BACI|nr:hypothetical protein [Virgibacillus halophilus]